MSLGGQVRIDRDDVVLAFLSTRVRIARAVAIMKFLTSRAGVLPDLDRDSVLSDRAVVAGDER